MAGTGKSVVTPVFRVSYSHVFVPQPAKNDPNKLIYSITGIFEPDADLSEMKRIAQEAKAKKWPDLGVIPKFKNPFRMGTPDEYDLAKNPEYDGKIIISMRSYNRAVAVVYGPDKKAFEIHEREKFYSGCYAIANVSAFAFDGESKGVSFGLNSVWKIKDGEPLAASHNPESDFAEVKLSDYGIDNSAQFAPPATFSFD